MVLSIELPIYTERLTIRRFELSDLEPLYSYMSDREVMRYELSAPITHGQAVSILERRMTSDEHFAIEETSTGTLLGHIYMGKRDFNSRELGYMLRRESWGKGFAAEAAGAVITAFFANGLHRVFAECDVNNTASYHLLERLGFQREGLLRQNVCSYDEKGCPLWKDSLIYGLLNNISL